MPWNFSYFYLSTNLFLIAISSFMGGAWLLNTQVAFICSMIITFASFYSYGNQVKKRLESGALPLENRDDPYDLFDEDDEDEIEPKNMKEMIKMEKARMKKGGSLEGLRSLSGLFFPYRLIAYLFLFIAFLYLNKNGLLEIVPFLLGLSVVPISSLLIPLFKKED